MRIKYRRSCSEDVEKIQRILIETWLKTYSDFIPQADLLVYLDEYHNLDALKKSLEDPNTVGFIAEVDDNPAGYEKTFYNKVEERLYVHQLYVLPQYQGLGLGKQLMEFAAERAKTFDLDRVWLGVMVDNTSALLWYQKLGYQIVERTPFKMGATTVDHYIGYVPINGIKSSDEIRQRTKDHEP